VGRFRKVVTVLALSLVLISALLAGVFALFIFATFGSGRSLVALGPTIKGSELQSCGSVLIDLERIEISGRSPLALLPNARQEIRITLSPEVEFNAGLLPRESVDTKILGYDICIATFESKSWSVMHSALGQPWFTLVEVEGLMASGTGTSLSFDAVQVSDSSLVIAFTDQKLPIQHIQLDAEITHSQANLWATALLVTAAAMIWLFIVLTVVFIIRTRKGLRA
jgi:hypothetical protein